MTIGDRIRKARRDSNLSQLELGRRLRVTQQRIAQYENGKRIPKTETLCKIATALGVHLSALTGIPTEPGKNVTDIVNKRIAELEDQRDRFATEYGTLNVIIFQVAISELERLKEVLKGGNSVEN